jgi:hypothetical protein
VKKLPVASKKYKVFIHPHNKVMDSALSLSLQMKREKKQNKYAVKASYQLSDNYILWYKFKVTT